MKAVHSRAGLKFVNKYVKSIVEAFPLKFYKGNIVKILLFISLTIIVLYDFKVKLRKWLTLGTTLMVENMLLILVVDLFLKAILLVLQVQTFFTLDRALTTVILEKEVISLSKN
jgi:hypothetical protein